MFFKSSANWEDELKRYGIVYHSNPVSLLKSSKDILFTTRCSAKKRKVSLDWYGYPKEYYAGLITQRFCRFCEEHSLYYGILSDFYGLIYCDDKIKTYDVHPSLLKESDFIYLGKKVRKKMDEKGYKQLIFYNPSPIMSVPYFKMLLGAKVPVYYITRLQMFHGFGL